MRKLFSTLGIITLLAGNLMATPPIPPSPESVPVFGIPVIAAGIIGYGIYKIAKKK